jgi:hypothetical protein
MTRVLRQARGHQEELLYNATMSGTSLSFVDLEPYDEVEVKIRNFLGNATAYLYAQISLDNGVSWRAAAGNYAWNHIWGNTTAVAQFDSTGTVTDPTDRILLTAGSYSVGGQAQDVDFTLQTGGTQSVHGTDKAPRIMGRSMTSLSGVFSSFGGYYGASARANALLIGLSAGSFTRGEIVILGRRK